LPHKNRTVEKIAPTIREAVRQTVSGEWPWPLVLCGPAGTGKTCAALCLLDHAGGGFYYTAQGLCEEVIRAQQGRLFTPQTGRAVPPEELWRELGGCALVVLDELGARQAVSDFHYETVKRLLDEREGMPLVVISNLDPKQLLRVYDDRIVSRLAAGTVVRLEG